MATPTPFNGGHPLTPFDEMVGERLGEREAQLDAIRQTSAYLEQISADTSGSDPHDFLLPEDAQACAEFVTKYLNAGKLDGSPLKEKLKMEVAVSGVKLWGTEKGDLMPVGVKAKNKWLDSGTKYKTVPREVIWRGVGVELGGQSISLVPGKTGYSKFYICEDGRLRCSHVPGMFPSSYGYGVGVIPNQLMRGRGNIIGLSIKNKEGTETDQRNNIPISLAITDHLVYLAQHFR